MVAIYPPHLKIAVAIRLPLKYGVSHLASPYKGPSSNATVVTEHNIV